MSPWIFVEASATGAWLFPYPWPPSSIRWRAKKAIAQALEAKGDPTILEMKRKSEKRGRADGLAEAVLELLSLRSLAVSEPASERIRATTDIETLKRWLRRAASASSIEEVLDEIL